MCTSAEPVSHLELVRLISERVTPAPRVALNTAPGKQPAQDDLYPDVGATQKRLGVRQTCGLEQTITKTYRWFATPHTAAAVRP